jgi:hypothetical protein
MLSTISGKSDETSQRKSFAPGETLVMGRERRTFISLSLLGELGQVDGIFVTHFDGVLD